MKRPGTRKKAAPVARGVAVPLAAPSSTSATGPAVPPMEGFKLGEWSGFTLYQCEQCPFATCSREAAVQHKRTACGRIRVKTDE